MSNRSILWGLWAYMTVREKGWLLPTVAVLLGVGFLSCTVGFTRGPSVGQARRVLRASLIYLPALLALLLVDGMSAPVVLAYRP